MEHTRANSAIWAAILAFCCLGLASVFPADAPPSWDQRVEVVRKLLITEWGWLGEEAQAELDSSKGELGERPELYARVLDSMLRIPTEKDLVRAKREKYYPLTRPYNVQVKLIRIVMFLGPEHARPLLREFEAVLRTQAEDLEWRLKQIPAEEKKQRERLQRRIGFAKGLHERTIEALMELKDRSLVPYIARTFPETLDAGEAKKGLSIRIMRRYLLQAARAGDSPALRVLRKLVEKHPRAIFGEDLLYQAEGGDHVSQVLLRDILKKHDNLWPEEYENRLREALKAKPAEKKDDDPKPKPKE